VDVWAEVAYAIERGRGAVRNDRAVRVVETLPCGSDWIELQPGGSELEVLRFAGASDTVHAVRDPLKQTSL